MCTLAANSAVKEELGRARPVVYLQGFVEVALLLPGLERNALHVPLSLVQLHRYATGTQRRWRTGSTVLKRCYT